MSESVVSKIGNAAKWSTITELVSRLITPITSMILARLLSPDAFGVVAIVTMLISFTDLFTDAGFQKYLVQHDFKNEEHLAKTANVAFWTNLAISIFLCLVLIVFRNPISIALGNPKLGNVIGVACLQLPLTSFSSIQMALYRRNFRYKDLFTIRMIASFVPLFVSLPLAIYGYGYWSVIIGSMCGLLISTIILTWKSNWKPKLYYNYEMLKKMLTFSIWSLFEAVSIWLTSWIDVLIIGSVLSEYYLGLYNISLNMVNSIMAIITSSITSVLFSALSRLQSDNGTFSSVFLNTQKLVAYLVFPLGIGMFLYKDVVTSIILGDKWAQASEIIGIWAIASAIRIVMVSIYSEAYRAKGKPKISLLVQLLDLLIVIPTLLISSRYGFWPVVYSRAIERLFLVIPGLIVMSKLVNINGIRIIKNITKPLICTSIMAIFSYYVQTISTNIFWIIFSIILSIVVYFLTVFWIDKNNVTAFLGKIGK